MSSHVYRALLILSLLHSHSHEADAQGAAQQEQAAALPSPTERLDRALAEPVTFDFDNTPLAEVAEQIRQRYRIPVHLDRKAIQAIGVSVDAPVTLKVRGISLRSGLNHLLRSLDLTWLADDGVLTITTVDEAEQQVVARCYPLADLVVAPELDTYRSELADFDSIIDLMTSVIAPTSWGDYTGPGPLHAVPAAGALVFEQMPSVHEDVLHLIAALRRARQLQFPNAGLRLPVADMQEPPTIVAIRKAQTRVVDLEFDHTPLADFLEQIAQAYRIPVLLDHLAPETTGVRADSPITVALHSVSLKSGLRYALQQLDLCAVVDNEVLFITTLDEAGQLLEIRTYPVLDLVETGEALWDFDSLVNAVTSAVDSTTWDDVGGPGSIEPFANAGVLVVSQTEAIHEKIAELLADLRAARDKQIPAPPQAAVAEPDDGRLHLKVYSLRAGYYDRGGGGFGGGGFGGGGFGGGGFGSGSGESDAGQLATTQPPTTQRDPALKIEQGPTTAQLAELIKQTIEPASWTGAGGDGTIHTLPNALVVRQSNSAHQRILKLLRALDYQMVVAQNVD